MAFEIDQSSLRQLSRRPTTRQCRSERVRLIIAVAYGRLFSLFLLLRLFLSIHFFVSVRMVRATLSLFLVSSHATVEKYPHLGKQPSLLLSKYLAKVWLLRTFGDFGRSPQPEWNRFGFRLFRYFSAPVQFFVSETSFGWVFFFLAERKLSLLKIIASLLRFVWRAFFFFFWTRLFVARLQFLSRAPAFCCTTMTFRNCQGWDWLKICSSNLLWQTNFFREFVRSTSFCRSFLVWSYWIKQSSLILTFTPKRNNLEGFFVFWLSFEKMWVAENMLRTSLLRMGSYFKIPSGLKMDLSLVANSLHITSL